MVGVLDLASETASAVRDSSRRYSMPQTVKVTQSCNCFILIYGEASACCAWPRRGSPLCSGDRHISVMGYTAVYSHCISLQGPKSWYMPPVYGDCNQSHVVFIAISSHLCCGWGLSSARLVCHGMVPKPLPPILKARHVHLVIIDLFSKLGNVHIAKPFWYICSLLFNYLEKH